MLTLTTIGPLQLPVQNWLLFFIFYFWLFYMLPMADVTALAYATVITYSKLFIKLNIMFYMLLLANITATGLL